MNRVLYILRYYPTLTETFVYEEIKALQARGYDIQIASMGSREDGQLSDGLPTAPVLQIPRRPLAGRLGSAGPGVRWLRRVQRAKDAARLPWLVSRVRNEVDRVHVHFAGEAAELAHALYLELGLPYSVMVHATDLFKPRPSLVEVLSQAAVVNTVCTHHQQVLEKMGIQARQVRCGPRIEDWTPRPLPPGPIRALCVARDVPKKGLDDLLEAWKTAPSGATLTLLSDLQRSELPPAVHVLGLKNPSEVREHMAESNLFILPCRVAPDGDMDGVPVALMEAMACGRPVISTDVSGISELVSDEVGWLIPPDNPHALRQAIHEASCSEERQRRGSVGPEHLEKKGFTLQSQVDGLLQGWKLMEF